MGTSIVVREGEERRRGRGRSGNDYFRLCFLTYEDNFFSRTLAIHSVSPSHSSSSLTHTHITSHHTRYTHTTCCFRLFLRLGLCGPCCCLHAGITQLALLHGQRYRRRIQRTTKRSSPQFGGGAGRWCWSDDGELRVLSCCLRVGVGVNTQT